MSAAGRGHGEVAVQRETQHLAALAHRSLRAGLALRAALSSAAAVVLIVVGVALARHGMADHVFPPFIDGGDPVTVTGYSGPWITAAVMAGAVAGLLLVSSVTDFWRRHLIGAAIAPPPASGPEMAIAGSHTSLGQ